MAIGTGALASQLVVVAGMPVLSRMYSPESFGLLGVVTAIILIAGSCVSGRWEFALPLERETAPVAALFYLSIATVLGSVTLFAMLFYLFGLNFFPGISRHYWLIVIAITIFALTRVFNYLSVKNKDFKLISVSLFGAGLMTVAAQLMLSNVANGLIYGHIMGLAVGLGIYLWCSSPPRLSSLRLRSIATMADKHKNFPKYSNLEGLLQALGNSFVPILIYDLYGAGLAGLYFFAARILNMPVSLLGVSLSQVYYERMSSSDLVAQQKLTNTVVKLILSTGTVVALLTWSHLTEAMDFIFGSQWYEAGKIMQILMPFVVLQLATAPITPLISVHQVQKYGLLWNVVLFAVRLGALLFFGVAEDFYGAIYFYSMLSFALYFLLLFSLHKLIGASFFMSTKGPVTLGFVFAATFIVANASGLYAQYCASVAVLIGFVCLTLSIFRSEYEYIR